MLLTGPHSLCALVDPDLQDLDRAVGNQLSGDRDDVDEDAAADQDSIVGAPRDELRKFVEDVARDANDASMIGHSSVGSSGGPDLPGHARRLPPT